MPTEQEIDVERATFRELIEQNTRVVEENNKLLKKIHRNAALAFWFRIAWFMILIGLPFILYFYILQPYFALFGANAQIFIDGIQEIPGYKSLSDAFCAPAVERALETRPQ